MTDADSPPPTDIDDILDDEPPADADVTHLTVDDREVMLVGTAHISQESVETVRRVIAAELPDTVCVELDEQRYKSLTEGQRWEELDLIEVIKNRKMTFLLARLALMAFQKRMGSYTGVKPGAEMAAAVEEARDHEVGVELVDRNVQTTLLRAWRTTPIWRRAFVAVSLIAGVFDSGEVDEADLAELRETPNITQILDELGEVLPSVKGVLVDERDLYMAHHIRNAPGDRIVAVVGAAHVPGIIRHLEGPDDPEGAEAVEHVPPRSAWMRLLPWVIPAGVIGLFAVLWVVGDPRDVQGAVYIWVGCNATLSALGAIAALAHPLTILAAAVAAPITSLFPTVGAGMVAALVQTLAAPPKVADMESVGDDIVEWKGWWKNRLSRILLVFLFASIGSSIATVVAIPLLVNLLG